jgi:hypothetical protein
MVIAAAGDCNRRTRRLEGKRKGTNLTTDALPKLILLIMKKKLLMPYY